MSKGVQMFNHLLGHHPMARRLMEGRLAQERRDRLRA